MGLHDVFIGTVSQPDKLMLGAQNTYWGCPDVARYPEGSQGKHGDTGPPQFPSSATASQELEQVVHCTEGLRFSLCLLFQGGAVSAGRKGCLLPITLRHTVYKSIALAPPPRAPGGPSHVGKGYRAVMAQ